MKTIKNSYLALIIICVLIIKVSVTIASDKTEIRNLKNFNSVKVSAGIELFLTMSDVEEVKVVADDEIIGKLVTEVKNGKLEVYMKGNSWFSWGTKSKKVYVKVKELKEIDASSGSEVKSENVLKGDFLKVESSSGSEVNIELVVKEVELRASSGSEIKVSGKSKNLKADSSSGSEINARDLESMVCNASASSGSDINIQVSDELNANASSGSDIDYYGNPSLKNINKSSGGDVSRK